MLFMFRGQPRVGLTEAEQQRGLAVFRAWKPPEGLTIKAHYLTATGGDYVIVETSSVEAMIEAVSNWAPFITYDVSPIVEVGDASASLARALAVRSAIA
ncbi:MAG TPA: DUF3303 family protein [Candidatus Binatia bacterium]|nr:DUF3303 family protein [Candidatus Binatia bacterium]